MLNLLDREAMQVLSRGDNAQRACVVIVRLECRVIKLLGTSSTMGRHLPMEMGNGVA